MVLIFLCPTIMIFCLTLFSQKQLILQKIFLAMKCKYFSITMDLLTANSITMNWLTLVTAGFTGNTTSVSRHQSLVRDTQRDVFVLCPSRTPVSVNVQCRCIPQMFYPHDSSLNRAIVAESNNRDHRAHSMEPDFSRGALIRATMSAQRYCFLVSGRDRRVGKTREISRQCYPNSFLSGRDWTSWSYQARNKFLATELKFRWKSSLYIISVSPILSPPS